MSLSQRMELRQGQSLVMTPQLLQAIKLLQLSHLDLVAYVDAELERNPLLERHEESDGPDVPERPEPVSEEPPAWDTDTLTSDRSSLEGDLDTSLDNSFDPDGAGVGPRPDAQAFAEGDRLPLSPGPWTGVGPGGSFDGPETDFEARLAREATLAEHLSSQLDLAVVDPMERLVGRFLIDAIDEAGWLAESVEAVAERLSCSVALVERVLATIQRFDPAGVGARDLAECLAIQLRERDRFDPAMQALVSRLDLLAKRDLKALERLCGVDEEDLAQMIREIRALDPKPGRAFGGAPVEVLVPDVFVRPAPDGSWLIDLNPDTLPRVLMNQAYYARVARSAKTETERAFVTECLQNANWLTRSLDQRAKTILKVASEIVRQQDGFFAHGVTHLRPLNLRTIADAIGMHESTVSRVTSNKSIGTLRGVFEMKYFFTAAIAGTGGDQHSSEAVRHRIRQLIDAERPTAVLSDDQLVKILRGDGIDIARRTVAKYRESLRIPSSIERRRAKCG
ncbi:RNA polymerase factor sigma-54 [Salinarimonas sp. NSM]|uniref:RNA polymerase factor sigma-54 n=1 Tax=Salinarimonas sp. NSM TaxID=3458003 RepID=UPI0040373D83